MDGDSTQKPNSPILCSNGCGFFGNPLTSNMCSKCYRDQQARQQLQHPHQHPVIESRHSEVRDNTEVTIPTPTPSSPQLPPEPENDGRKVQADTSRCWSCQKKVGLLGFKCRCDYVFCATHRYSDKHECNFDYKTMNKAALQKANPVVKGSKLDKI